MTVSSLLFPPKVYKKGLVSISLEGLLTPPLCYASRRHSSCIDSQIVLLIDMGGRWRCDDCGAPQIASTRSVSVHPHCKFSRFKKQIYADSVRALQTIPSEGRFYFVDEN